MPTTVARRARAALAALLAVIVTGSGLVGPGTPAGAELPPPTEDGRPPRDMRSIEVLNVAHRAEVRGADTPPPENTLAAIEEAIRAGADAVELDVTLTADDELVLMHDRSLNRTTNAVEVFGPGTHHTADRTLAELRTLSAGTFQGEVQRIPTFGEALELIRGRTGFLIDVKYDHSDTAIEPLIAAELHAQPGFDEWGPDTVSFGSYGWTSLQAARELLPDLELTFIMNYLCLLPNGVIAAGDLPPARAEGIPGITPLVTTIDEFTQALAAGGIDTVGIFYFSYYKGTTQSCTDNDFTAADLQRFADAGIRFAQNAETPAAMAALADRGVRAILTDFTDVLARTLPAPDAPTDVTAVPGRARATVSWTEPDPYRGSRRTGYTITAQPGGATVDVGPDATSAVVEGLTPGVAHTFTVTARNFAGAGPASDPSAAVTPAPEATDDELYVAWLYEHLLGRGADPGGLAHWTAALEGGRSRASVAGALRRSPESTSRRDVAGTYAAWLGRAAEPSARTWWTAQLQGGLPRWRFEAGVLGSDELHRRAGSDAEWVRQVFTLTLGRSASATDVQYFTGQLTTGLSRGVLAARIRTSPEGARAAVLAAYADLLDRPGTGDPLLADLVALQSTGRDVRAVEVALAATDEAYALATGQG